MSSTKLKQNRLHHNNITPFCLVGCNVTGLDEGTANNPKLLLLALFCDQVSPKTVELVDPGGVHNRYLPVVDNAGCHADGAFHTFMKGFCQPKGMEVGAA